MPLMQETSIRLLVIIKGKHLVILKKMEDISPVCGDTDTPVLDSGLVLLTF